MVKKSGDWSDLLRWMRAGDACEESRDFVENWSTSGQDLGVLWDAEDFVQGEEVLWRIYLLGDLMRAGTLNLIPFGRLLESLQDAVLRTPTFLSMSEEEQEGWSDYLVAGEGWLHPIRDHGYSDLARLQTLLVQLRNVGRCLGEGDRPELDNRLYSLCSDLVERDDLMSPLDLRRVLNRAFPWSLVGPALAKEIPEDEG